MAMKGLHNAANAMAAHALMSAIEAPQARSRRRCASSRAAAPSRAGGRGEEQVRFYDDSKGTNVGATVAALEGFRSR
jgi:UDP-N-acetylmuramoylalanine--D-glutamate ligase